MQKFIEYFNNKNSKIGNLYTNDTTNRNHHSLHIRVIYSLKIKIIGMIKTLIPNEEASYFNNEIYNRLLSNISDRQLAIKASNILSTRIKMLIKDLIDGIFYQQDQKC